MREENGSPVRPQSAATVVFVRQESELQVYLSRRSPAIRFMGGMYAFPGGRVDTRDRETRFWKDHVDLDEAGVVERVGDDLAPAEGLACGIAAVREAFEESGILLADTGRGTSGREDELRGSRTGEGLAEGWLAEQARLSGWRLTLSNLWRWSRWVTPEGMRKRYDTVFFVAELPLGQSPCPDGREVVHAVWASPEEALARNLAGEVPLSPPTLVTLHELLPHSSLASLRAALSRRKSVPRIRPRLVLLEKGSLIVEPWDPEFSQEEIRIPSVGLERRVLAVGQPFSRIWFNGKCWRAIAV